jgi:hypothetical protein
VCSLPVRGAAYMLFGSAGGSPACAAGTRPAPRTQAPHTSVGYDTLRPRGSCGQFLRWTVTCRLRTATARPGPPRPEGQGVRGPPRRVPGGSGRTA